jgi:hypothetical protein
VEPEPGILPYREAGIGKAKCSDDQQGVSDSRAQSTFWVVIFCYDNPVGGGGRREGSGINGLIE